MTTRKTLEQWMSEVDAAVKQKCGLSVYDLPDCPFADWHEDGMTPRAAANRAIRAANGADE